MTTEQLYKQVQLIYNQFDFEQRNIIDGLMIVSKDNYFQCFLTLDKNQELNFRISKHYSLVKNNFYLLNYYLTGKIDTEASNHEDHVPNEFKTHIVPHFRKFTLERLLNDPKN